MTGFPKKQQLKRCRNSTSRQVPVALFFTLKQTQLQPRGALFWGWKKWAYTVPEQRCCTSTGRATSPPLPVGGRGGLCYPWSAGPTPRELGQRSGVAPHKGGVAKGGSGESGWEVERGWWGWEGGGEGGASGDGCRPRLGRARCQGLSGAPSLSGSLPRTPSWACRRDAGVHGQCKTGPSAPLPLAPAHASAPTITCSIGTLWK